MKTQLCIISLNRGFFNDIEIVEKSFEEIAHFYLANHQYQYKGQKDCELNDYDIFNNFYNIECNQIGKRILIKIVISFTYYDLEYKDYFTTIEWLNFLTTSIDILKDIEYNYHKLINVIEEKYKYQQPTYDCCEFDFVRKPYLLKQIEEN